MLNPVKIIEPIIKSQLGGKQRPVFMSIPETNPDLLILDKGWLTIKDELNQVMKQVDSLPAYDELDIIQTSISTELDPDLQWKVYMLQILNKHNPDAYQDFPKTMGLLDQIPDIAQAFFSILEPGKSVPPHCGPYAGVQRYHLGLHVPQNNPPSIIVNGESYTWKEGESVLFDDSWEHEVINKSDEYRSVLIVDTIRPLKFPYNCLNRFFIWLASKVYGYMIFSNMLSKTKQN